MTTTVFARPDELERFRDGAAEAAEELARRASSLDLAVSPYLRHTERAYEAPCEAAPGAVRAYADALAALGGWVGREGAAFLESVLFRGGGFTTMERLLQQLPLGLHLGPVLPSAGAMVAAEVVASGAHPRDLRAVAQLFGPASAAGSGLAQVADSSAGRSIGRYLDWGAAVARGASESEARWRSEPDQPFPARLARAAFDGALNAAGAYAGGGVGAAGGAYACAPLGPPTQAVCASAGARAGSAVGGAVAELASDAVLGPEPVVFPRLADATVLVEGQVEATTARARAEADLRTDFVLERPWLWDDEFADAPAVAAPEPAEPPAPQHGPR